MKNAWLLLLVVSTVFLKAEEGTDRAWWVSVAGSTELCQGSNASFVPGLRCVAKGCGSPLHKDLVNAEELRQLPEHWDALQGEGLRLIRQNKVQFDDCGAVFISGRWMDQNGPADPKKKWPIFITAGIESSWPSPGTHSAEALVPAHLESALKTFNQEAQKKFSRAMELGFLKGSFTHIDRSDLRASPLIKEADGRSAYILSYRTRQAGLSSARTKEAAKMLSTGYGLLSVGADGRSQLGFEHHGFDDEEIQKSLQYASCLGGIQALGQGYGIMVIRGYEMEDFHLVQWSQSSGLELKTIGIGGGACY